MKPLTQILVLTVLLSLVQFACDREPQRPPDNALSAELERARERREQMERIARPCRAIVVDGTPCVFCADFGYNNQSMALSCNWGTDGGTP